MYLSSTDIADIDGQWDAQQQQLHDKLTSAAAVSSLWQQFNEPRNAVTKTLNNVTPVIEQELVFSSRAEAKKALDQLKVEKMSPWQI